MAGLLDMLMGNNGAVSPWSALYPSPVAQGSTDDFLNALRSAGETGQAPGQTSPFGDPSKPSVAMPGAPATGFGAGAVPFGFAGPGSMSGVNPSQFAAPTGPQPSPAAPVAQAPAQAPTDASSVNRSSAPDDFIHVGDYQMPAFRSRGVAPDTQEAAPATPVAAQAPALAVAPVAPATGAPAAAPFSLGGAGDRLGMSTRGFLGNLHNGPIAAIAGGLGSLITGQESDPTAIVRQKANASAQALVSKGASPAEAAAAVNNPALMTALIQQYYGKDKWSVVKTGKDADGNEIYMQQNQVDGTLRPLPASARSPGGGAPATVTGPDGKPIVIPPGVDRKEFIKQVTHANADAATGKQTEAQAKSAAYAARMQKAQDELAKLDTEGLSATQAIASGIPLVGNYLQSDKHQQYETAKSAFISAKLRAESGAAISPAEYTREEKELFPQPGDGPARVQQKAQLRAAALDEMKRSAGPGYQTRAAAPAAPAAAASGKTSSGISWSVQ